MNAKYDGVVLVIRLFAKLGVHCVAMISLILVEFRRLPSVSAVPANALCELNRFAASTFLS